MKTKVLSRLFPLLVGVAGLLVAAPLLAVDYLTMPAVQSGKAGQALLLDVADRGDGHFVAVGEHGVIVVSGENGNGWTQAKVPASVMLTAVQFPTPKSGWAVGHDGLILHSGDGGMNWEKQYDGFQLNEQLVAVAQRIVDQVQAEVDALQNADPVDEPALEDAEYMLEEAEFMLEGAQDDAAAGPVRPLLDVWFRNEQEGFVAGSYGMLLHTADGGRNWELVSDRMDNPEAFHLNQIAVAPDGKLFIAGEAGFVYRSADGGQTWDTLEPGYDGSFYGTVIAVGDAEGYELLVHGLRGNLFQSLDQGETWSPLDSGTTISLTTGLQLRDGTVVLAGQAGLLLERPPGGDAFQAASNPDRRVISGAVQDADGNLLLVGLGGVRHARPDGSPLTPANESP